MGIRMTDLVETSGHLHCWPWAATHHELHLFNPSIRTCLELLYFTNFSSASPTLTQSSSTLEFMKLMVLFVTNSLPSYISLLAIVIIATTRLWRLNNTTSASTDNKMSLAHSLHTPSTPAALRRARAPPLRAHPLPRRALVAHLCRSHRSL
jgi:hypothetical protein